MNCKAKTNSGQPCKMPATKGGRFCFNHSPAHAAQRAQARKLGGQNRHTPHAGNPEAIPTRIGSIDDIGALLDYIRAELIAADNSIPRARALISLAETYIRSLEIGEYEARIAALEARQK